MLNVGETNEVWNLQLVPGDGTLEAACELLDAVVRLCIGANATSPDRGQDASEVDFSRQYRHLFPAMLRLAADSNGLSDPYVICHVPSCEAQKTHVIRKSISSLSSALSCSPWWIGSLPVRKLRRVGLQCQCV